MNKNIERSKKLKKAIRAKAKQCYANAWNAIETQEEYKDATYVEGMAVVNGLAIEHGWIEHEGEVIDPTLLDENIVHFPGLRFKGREGLHSTWRIPGFMETGEKLPVFYRFGWGGVDSPEFLQVALSAKSFPTINNHLKRSHKSSMAFPNRNSRWSRWLDKSRFLEHDNLCLPGFISRSRP